MKNLGFVTPDGQKPSAGTGEICAFLWGVGGKLVQLLRGAGMALGPAALALVLLGASALVFAVPAQAQTITCTGGPVSANDVSVRYVKATNTCTLSTDISNLTGAGDLKMMALNAAPVQLFGERGLGAGASTLNFSVCNFGPGVGDLGAANCGTSIFPDATDLTATFEWDSTNPTAPGAPDRRATVNYRRDAGVMTIQSATITVLGPEIAVDGNGTDIANGDTTPSTADDTDFGAVATGASVAKTFTIRNMVNTNGPNLVLGANAVTITGSSDFTVTTQPDETIKTDTFSLQRTDTVITFTPSSSGPKTATVSISNNDFDESPFTFTIQGNADGSSASASAASGVTSQQVTDFLGARNGFILDNQPDSGRRIDRLNGSGGGDEGSASVSALGFAASLPSPVDFTIANGQLSYAASASEAAAFLDARTGDAKLPDIGKWDIWTEGSFDLFTDNVSQSGTFGIASLGADYLVSEEILLGLKVQADWMRQNFAATSGTVTGLGAMIGPYATIALTDNLFVDLSAMWGMSANDISPFGTYTDRFWSSRVLLDGSIIGKFEMGGWTLRPTLSTSYISDQSLAYTDSNGVVIPSQTVAQGQVSFAPRISYAFELEAGEVLTPWVEPSGQFVFQTAGAAPTANSFAAQMLGLTGAVSAGFDLLLPSGISIAVSGDYGGIGTRAESYGGRVGLSAPIN